jgi:predicted dehydrogenase
MDPLRVGIVGYGLAGRVFHGGLVSCTDGMRVAAIATGNAERQAQARADHPDAAIHASAEALLAATPALDLVVVATPNREHARIAKAALDAGVAVVIDKPIAHSSDAAAELLTAAERTGALLTVFHNRRWDSDFLTVRRLVDEDVLGQIVRFESRYERYRPSLRPGAWREAASVADGGGLLFDLGVHLVDQAMVLFGAPRSVYAEVAARRPGGPGAAHALVARRFDRGVIAHLWVSHIPRRLGARMRVIGMRGAYEKSGIDPQEDMLRAGLRPGSPSWGREPPEAWGRMTTEADGVAHDAALESEPGRYQAFYDGVRDALIHGAPPPVAPADAAAAVRVIEAAHESGRTGAVVALDR